MEIKTKGSLLAKQAFVLPKVSKKKTNPCFARNKGSSNK